MHYFNVLSGISQSGPLTLLVALIQFTAPNAYLSTATGLAFSARAFGSAVLDAIINSKPSSTSIVPFVVVALVAVGELMTEVVEATVEREVGEADGEKVSDV